jgi:hypothetical protein
MNTAMAILYQSTLLSTISTKTLTPLKSFWTLLDEQRVLGKRAGLP